MSSSNATTPSLSNPSKAEIEWMKTGSSSKDPKVFQIVRDEKAQFMIYAIHGLKSNTATWGGYGKKDKPDGKLRWLEHLKDPAGNAVDVSLVGWDTEVFSATNFSTDVKSSVRSLANTIIGLRGETKDTRALNERDGNQGKPQKVIIIGHSMGGILARALLGFMHEQGTSQPEYATFLKSITGVILLASPSGGSGLADFAKPFADVISHSTALGSLYSNPAHLDALKPGSAELTAITKEFDVYCEWYKETVLSTGLKMAALRETTNINSIFPKKVVSGKSGDIPDSTKKLTDWKTEDLEGLNHMQVTKYASMEDLRLKKILAQISRMQQP